MRATGKYIALRMVPVVFVAGAATFWFSGVQDGGPHVARNVAPLAVLIALAWFTLRRGGGAWRGAGMQLPLATVGYAIPVLGLSCYLHYAYSVNLNDMFGDALYPERIFVYLPLYTVGAGVIGFAIGWIIGRNV